MRWPPLGDAVPRRRNRLTRCIGRVAIRLWGWRIEGEWPNEPRLIVIVAPHSSNLDFLLSVAIFWGLDLRTGFLAKHSLFRFPLGTIMRFLGGIPVDRTAPHGLVGQLVRTFAEQESLIVGITPEGTRGRVREWRSGFAQIAASAGVPVLPAIVNYDRHLVYLQPLVRELATAAEIMAATRCAAEAVGAPRHRR